MLNGYDYRGRKLVVSYSKLKDDDETLDNEDALSEEDAAAYAAAEKAAANNEPFSAPHITSDSSSEENFI